MLLLLDTTTFLHNSGCSRFKTQEYKSSTKEKCLKPFITLLNHYIPGTILRLRASDHLIMTHSSHSSCPPYSRTVRLWVHEQLNLVCDHPSFASLSASVIENVVSTSLRLQQIQEANIQLVTNTFSFRLLTLYQLLRQKSTEAMALTFLHLLFAISAFNLCGSSTFASAGTPQSLGAELVPGGVINGCCSQAFLNATIAEMSNILSVATAQSLLSHGLTMNNLVVNPFVLINTNLCLVRQRNLLRGSETENGDAVQRKAKTYTNTCGVSHTKRNLRC